MLFTIKIEGLMAAIARLYNVSAPSTAATLHSRTHQDLG
jgi:hypothetical protein